MKASPTALGLLAAALMLVATDATAQQRRPLLGKVVQQDDSALADATVHCVYVPPGAEGSKAEDHVQATTDARGRFRVNVLPCANYRIWAVGKPDETGARLCSGIELGGAGAIVALSATQEQKPCRLQIEGLEAWADAGPLKVRFAPAVALLDDMVFDIDENGTTELPPLPFGSRQVDILDARGQPLQSTTFRRKKGSAKVKLYEPKAVPMRIVDEQGQPMAGVRVRQRMSGGWVAPTNFAPSSPPRHLWRDLGESDADGKLNVKIASRNDPFEKNRWHNLLFVASKHGFAETHSGFTERPFFDGKEQDGEDITALRFTMRKQPPVTGSLVRGGDNVLGKRQLTLRIAVKIESVQKNSWRNESYVCHVTTEQDGTFTIPAVTKFDDDVAVLIGGAGLTEVVPAELQRMAPPQPIALRRRQSLPKKQLRIDIGNLPTLQVQILDETGGPATGAQALLLSNSGNRRNDSYECDGWTPSATADSAGRLAMLVEPGEWLLFARTETGYLHRKLNLESGATKLELRLQPMPAMLGKVVDADGKPVAGATVSVNGSSWRSHNGRDEALTAIASHMNWSWIGATKSGADGSFAIRFLDLPGMTYRATLRKGKRKSEQFEVEVGSDLHTITVE